MLTSLHYSHSIQGIMVFDFNELSSKMPAGVLVTDPHLEVLYMNTYARERIFSLRPGQDSASVMMNRRFYTTDRQDFDMGGCMKNMVRDNRRSFHKTLILARREGEILVFFTASAFLLEGSDYYLFVLVDISAEMDCITHSPGGFGREDFIISQRIIGRDSRIRELYRLISLAAASTVNVMVTGESGTGKELVADAIHALSERREGPLIKVNCSALSESLLESELFGHVRGAFTGAVRDKMGKFEQAHGGTLFLDEIGEISQSLQVKLLRVIQEKTIERVGDTRSIPVDMRIVAATNRDLREMIKEGRFREDLYYRLNVFSVHMPPLRERQLDIPLLCDHFIEQNNERSGKQIKGLGREAMRLVMRYPWPGNVRELQNAIEHAFVLAGSGLIAPDDLPDSLRLYRPAGQESRPDLTGIPNTAALRKGRGGRLPIGREQLAEVLESHGWNQSETARALGISRVALWKKIRKFDLSPPSDR